MRLSRKIKCQKCGTKTEAQNAYRFWHHVECYETFHGIRWIRDWWLCTPKCLSRRDEIRFHDIDGYQYRLSWKFPYIQRFGGA